tara:strand:+ start:2680 stop:3396 length:717 start_codon:yes stop_codon:yes gene_type:complete
MHYIFTIEGNIGSGKSTLLNILKQNLTNINDVEIEYLPEPVSMWESITDTDGINIIEKFYNDNKKYAFSFQMMAYISRIHQIKKTLKGKKNVIIICERSVFTDKKVFTQMLYDDKKISEIDYQIYNNWFYEFIRDIPISGIIYLKTDTEICSKRVVKRNRTGEDIPIEYLENCNKYHNKWLLYESIPLIILNGNQDFNKNLPKTWINILKTFIIDLSPTFSTSMKTPNVLIDNGMPIF